MFKAIAVLAISFWLAILNPAAAVADSAGAIPGPGTCDFPAIGDWGMVGEGLAAEYWWYCDEPMEPANNSHRHCEYEGAATEFQGGISAFIFSVQAGTHLGLVVGGCHYRCPNNALAEEDMPNPPGLWLLGEAADKSKPCRSKGDPLPATPVLAPQQHVEGFSPPAAGPVDVGPQVVP